MVLTCFDGHLERKKPENGAKFHPQLFRRNAFFFPPDSWSHSQGHLGMFSHPRKRVMSLVARVSAFVFLGGETG